MKILIININSHWWEENMKNESQKVVRKAQDPNTGHPINTKISKNWTFCVRYSTDLSV